MTGIRTSAKFFVFGLASTVAPCLAFAVNAPSNGALEQVDTALLGTGQDAAPPLARVVSAPGWTVQVGSYADRDAAEARLIHVAGLAPNELSRAAPTVVPFGWGNGRVLYRARFTGFSEQGAQALCATLTTIGESCFAAADETVYSADNGVIEAAASAMPALRGSSEQVDASVAQTAKNPNASLLDSSRLVSNDDLSNMRGGFFTAGGAQFDFGASVQTLVNGQVALQTNLQWTPAGAMVQQLAGLGASIQAQVAANLAKVGIADPVTGATTPTTASNTPATVSNTTPTLASNTIPVVVSNTTPVAGNTAPAVTGNAAPAVAVNTPVSSVSVPATSTPIVSVNTPTTSTPAGSVSTPTTSISNTTSTTVATNAIPAAVSNPTTSSGNTVPATTPAAPTILTGVQIQSPTGSTQVFSNVNAGQIENIILNSASNQTITQNTNITLTIYNFAAWQQQLAQHALGAQLANEILAASGLGRGH